MPNKFLALITSLLLVSCLILLNRKIEWFFWISLVLFFIMAGSVFLVLKPKISNVIFWELRKDLFFWKVLFLGMFFLFGGVIFFLILKNPLYKNIFLFLTLILWFLFFLKIEKRKNFFLSEYLILISSFFWFVGLSVIPFYAEMNLWLFTFLIGAITFILSFLFFLWSQDLFTKETLNFFVLYSVILALLNFQIAWVIGYLPLGYIVNGTIFFLSFFTFLGIVKEYLQKNLSRKIFFEYLGISLTFLLILFLTAQWKPVI